MSRAQRLANLLGDGRAELGAPVLLPGTGSIPMPYALARVLEHGPMTRSDLLRCTRWAEHDLDQTIAALMQLKLVKRICFGFAGLSVYEAVQ
jgi:hypothetical protein